MLARINAIKVRFSAGPATPQSGTSAARATLGALQEAGITHVWLPPPSQSVSPQGYLPGQLYKLDTKYGSKEQLVRLNQALKLAQLKPMADIVINHR